MHHDDRADTGRLQRYTVPAAGLVEPRAQLLAVVVKPVGRFRREAEVLASLNHTNIAAIYDLQEANGSFFLILELVEGETLADRLAGYGFPLAIDEPYQHYQFAGRADVLAWDLAARAMLHVENRTRFPNIQDAIGSYNSKRRYLPAVMAERLGIRGGFASVTNVITGLWSNEVIHVARIRAATFRAVCPDDRSAFEAWWSGKTPTAAASTSTFLLLDPVLPATPRRSAFVGLEQVLEGSIRPRYRGYADAVDALRREGSL